MMKQKSTIQTFALLMVIGLALSLAPEADSLPSGIAGQAEKGCICHGAIPDSGVTPSITGLPSTFNASTTYTLTVSFTGGPSGIDTTPMNLGGFNLAVSSGTLTAVDEWVKIENGDAVHNGIDDDVDNNGIDDSVEAGGEPIASGNDFTSWTVNWTSPESGSTTFNLAVNSVNGDGVASADDKWNTMSVSVSGPSAGFAAEPLEPADPFVVLATLIIVSGILLGAVILYTFYRVNPDGFSWESFAPWITEWLTSTDHKKIGTLYFLAGFFFLGVGGIMAMLIRIQLAVPGNDFLTQDQYNQFFTMHGTVMIFLAAMPLINGFANWLIPLQIGAADLALPRINAMSFWLQPVGALLIFTGIFSGTAADTGWTGYAPYIVSETAHTGTTLWVAGQILLVASSTLTGINFLTTICAMRAPTMGWMQMPLFTWSILIANLMLFISIPAWGVGLIQVYLDRTISTAFYHVASGGDPLLWSHLFWYFGHPEVYVVIVPAFGVISEVIATSARRSIFGYRSMVYAMAGIGIVAFIVYGHHMFTSGMSPTLRFVTMLTTMLVAVPTGIKIFNWLKTMHKGSLIYRTHTLWALGFLVTFTLGGISGMFFPSLAMDTHLHETYFVVAHFHYVFVGGTVFGIFSGLYYWFPKMSGKMMDEKWGLIHFLTAFISFNGIFWPMHKLGVMGMARRHHTWFVSVEEYSNIPAEMGDWNLFITVCAFLFFFSNFILVGNMIKTIISGKKAPADPWGGWSFEWMCTSPPPTPSFDPHNLPILHDANEYHETEPGRFGKWFASLMVQEEDSEVSH